MQYSTRFPDGRTLVIVPDVGGAIFKLDGNFISETEAEEAWEDQPHEWQRGRTLKEAFRFWQGRG